MGKVTGEAHVNRPLAESFKFMADTTNWPKVEKDLVEARPKGPVSKGSKGTETRKMGKRSVEATWEITEFEANKHTVLYATGPGIKIWATTNFAEMNGGTHIKFAMDYKTQGLMMMLMAPMVKMQFNKTTSKMMTDMKSAIEAAK